MGWILVDYECEPCGVRWESLEDRPAPVRVLHVACGKMADRLIGAPKPRVATVLPTPVQRGRYEDRPGPRAVDTRAIADGASVSEWKAQRRKVWQEHRYQQVKREIG